MDSQGFVRALHVMGIPQTIINIVDNSMIRLYITPILNVRKTKEDTINIMLA